MSSWEYVQNCLCATWMSHCEQNFQIATKKNVGTCSCSILPPSRSWECFLPSAGRYKQFFQLNCRVMIDRRAKSFRLADQFSIWNLDWKISQSLVCSIAWLPMMMLIGNTSWLKHQFSYFAQPAASSFKIDWWLSAKRSNYERWWTQEFLSANLDREIELGKT